MNKIKLLCTLFALCTTAHTSAIENKKETTTQANNQKDMKERCYELSTAITEIDTYIKLSKASYTGRFSNLVYTDGTKGYRTRSSFSEYYHQDWPKTKALDQLGKDNLQKNGENPEAFYKRVNDENPPLSPKDANDKLYWLLEYDSREPRNLAEKMNLAQEGVEAFYERIGKRVGESYSEYKKRDKGPLSAENAPIGLWRLYEVKKELQAKHSKLLEVAKKPLPDTYVIFNRKPNKEGEDFLKTIGATKQLEYGLDRDDSCLFKDVIKKKYNGNMWEISPKDFRRLTRVHDCYLEKLGCMFVSGTSESNGKITRHTGLDIEKAKHVNEILWQFIEDGTFYPQDCPYPIDEKDLKSLANKIREFDAIAQEFAKTKQALPEID